MKKIKDVLFAKNICVGYLYFYVHMITEILCFFVLSRVVGNLPFIWIFPLIYDSFAFMPQGIIGAISDKYPKIPIGIIGTILLIFGVISCHINFLPGKFTGLIILCLGNTFLHVAGAEVTLRSSEGKLSHSAIFVSGGSFGVIIGKILGTLPISYWWMCILGLTMIPFITLGEEYRKENEKTCNNFNYQNEKISPGLIVILAVIIVIVRGYMGYGIPQSWNKSLIQMITLFCIMGLGKALGGILSDLIGMRKVAVLSMLISTPFLIIGDNHMFISLIGVMFFSMTMAVTLGLLTSVLKRKPGLAFGLTTIGLFLGTVPVFFFRIKTGLINSIMITLLSIICCIISLIIIRKEDNSE